ncbi:hypothetical protein B0H16DRAFT_1691324 [Mycena metata]|uniref:Uncharacterized protein n=1 Tax=Mycena metata TaxID=1033252 RepID=A0AAD7IVT1_9AGAR|nr:hypothetical protein B0H16DRAFT_1691324 [Mycena metata]
MYPSILFFNFGWEKAWAQARAQGFRPRTQGSGSGLENLKPEPAQAEPEPGHPGRAGPATSLLCPQRATSLPLHRSRMHHIVISRQHPQFLVCGLSRLDTTPLRTPPVLVFLPAVAAGSIKPYESKLLLCRCTPDTPRKARALNEKASGFSAFRERVRSLYLTLHLGEVVLSPTTFFGQKITVCGALFLAQGLTPVESQDFKFGLGRRSACKVKAPPGSGPERTVGFISTSGYSSPSGTSFRDGTRVSSKRRGRTFNQGRAAENLLRFWHKRRGQPREFLSTCFRHLPFFENSVHIAGGSEQQN